MSKTDLSNRELVAVGDALAQARRPVTRSAWPLAAGCLLTIVGSVLAVLATRDAAILGAIVVLAGTLLVIFGLFHLGRNVDRSAIAADAVLAVALRIEALLEQQKREES